MGKPKIYKGLCYSFPERGMMAIYVPNDDYQGSKLYVLRLTEQTQPIAYLLRRLIDEATRMKWYEGFWAKATKREDPKMAIQRLLETPKSEGDSASKPGRIVKASSRAEYEPNRSTHGGRVVKLMPRQLKKIKEGQEQSGEMQ